MKRNNVFSLIMVLILVATAVLAGYVTGGFGKSLTATTTPQWQAVNDGRGGDYGMYIRFTVTGTQPIRVLLNSPTNYFVATNALVVSPGFPETFFTGERITGFSYGTESGSSAFTANVMGE